MRTGKSPSYLIRNNYSYCFRIKVPKNLQATVSKKELRYSLGTYNLSAAKNKARYLAGQFQLLFRDIQRGCLDYMKLTKDQINKLINEHKEMLFEHYDKPVPYGRYDGKLTPDSEASAEYQWMYCTREELHHKLIAGDYSEIEKTADEVLTKLGLAPDDIDKTSPEYSRLCSGLMRAEIKGLDRYEKILHGKFEDDLEDMLNDKISAPLSLPKKEKTSITLSEFVEKYASENKNVWAVSTANDYQSMAKILLRFLGDNTQVHTINRSTIREYREVLMGLPPRFMTTKKYDHMTAKDVLNLKLGPDEVINPKTINKNFGYISGLFRFAVNMGYISENPATDMLLKTSDKEAVIFTKEDLVLIFKNLKYSEKYPYRFWLTLLGLFTGARANELCQLYVKDIKMENNIWYIDINSDSPDKGVKNQSSRRILPLHSSMIDLGFIKYVKSLDQDGRVFPELTFNKHRHKYTDNYSKWFNRLLSDLGIKLSVKDQKEKGMSNATFHTFRHTLITTLVRADINILKVKEAIGHEKGEGTTTKTYFHGFPIKQIYDEVISKIDYGIDLSHLKNSKFADPDS